MPRRRIVAKGEKNVRIEAEERIMATAPMDELLGELRSYPLRLLLQILAEHRRRGIPVPDHSLDIVPYLGDTVLRALVDAGLVTRVDDTAYAIRAYLPTGEGLKLGAQLVAG